MTSKDEVEDISWKSVDHSERVLQLQLLMLSSASIPSQFRDLARAPNYRNHTDIPCQSPNCCLMIAHKNPEASGWAGDGKRQNNRQQVCFHLPRSQNQHSWPELKSSDLSGRTEFGVVDVWHIAEMKDGALFPEAMRGSRCSSVDCAADSDPAVHVWNTGTDFAANRCIESAGATIRFVHTVAVLPHVASQEDGTGEGRWIDMPRSAALATG